MDYKKLNNITGWVVFAIATIVYMLTIEPTVSLWDCGEYITTANKLEVGHPPGAPTFMMLGRIFSAFVSVENVAMMVNAMSALSSSFGILFLFWTITYLAKKIATRDGAELNNAKIIAILGSGLIGGLGYAFTDSYWFNAVEGEVYAMSSFLTAITFWAALKWESVADEPHANRWLVLIMFIIGLSIGVHLLNLLAIPAIAYIYYFKKYENTTLKGFLVFGAIGIVLLGVIQAGVIPKTPEIAAAFERFAVNSLGLPLNIGTLIFGIVLFSAIAFGIYYTQKKAIILWNTVLVSLLVLFIGYSSFTMIVIRSNANTPLDENNPETLDGLVSYLNRDQYGSAPLLYGEYFNSPLKYEIGSGGKFEPVKTDGKPAHLKVFAVKDANDKKITDFTSRFLAEQYIKEHNTVNAKIKAEYIIENFDNVTQSYRNADNVYHPEFQTLFPRMYFRGEDKVKGYKSWSNYEGRRTDVTAFQKDGGTINVNQYLNGPINKPTFGENLRYFFQYQVNFMYFRYFMWNFAGRQTDQQGHDYNTYDGQWISGLNFIDKERIGTQENLPAFIAENKAHNKYYLIPLLFGLIGLVFHFVRAPKDMFLVFLMFFFTGIAIVIYLNQKPVEPRERDYAYAGSFYAFAIWIGLGVYALFDLAKTVTLKQISTIAAYVFGGGIIVTLFSMAAFNSGMAMAYGIFYLGSLALLLILIMYGVGKLSEKASALTAVVIGVVVPVILIADNWDDHSRANRYTAKAFAVNYLNSCKQNAILFTNGDNDTFPLWYAQEVEGIRTDMRVANLSLLSTDWHVEQMKRKAYESEPLPIKLPERAYRPSVRNYIEIKEAKNKNKFYDAKRLVKYIGDDKNIKASSLTGMGETYCPAKKVQIPVNKENVKKWLPKKWHDYIQDTLQWTLSGRIMYKSDIAMLDMLSNYEWDRPVYFASTSGMQAMKGLEPYTVMEGFTYMLVPVHKNITRSVDVDGMWNKLMTDSARHFTWGNLERKDVYIDNYTRRMTYSSRLMFIRLAQNLLAEGDKERAIQVLDKCLEVIPGYNVPYHSSTSGSNFLSMFAELYEKAGAKEKADEIYKELVETYAQHIAYFASVDVKFLNKTKNDIISAYQNLTSSFESIQSLEVKSEVENKYKTALEGFILDVDSMISTINMDLQLKVANKSNVGLLQELKGVATVELSKLSMQ